MAETCTALSEVVLLSLSTSDVARRLTPATIAQRFDVLRLRLLRRHEYAAKLAALRAGGDVSALAPPLDTVASSAADDRADVRVAAPTSRGALAMGELPARSARSRLIEPRWVPPRSRLGTEAATQRGLGEALPLIRQGARIDLWPNR